MRSSISPERILKELAELWISLGKSPDKEGVLRACSMTLVVLADHADDPAAIGETLAALMPEHPSRAIVVRFTAAPGRALAARVFAQCWMPFGHRSQICCEQVEITASDENLPGVPAVVLPLAVPDLPVMVWCRSPRLFQSAEFPRIAAIARKVIIDSAAFSRPAEALQAIAARSGRGIGDLAWTRLTRLREMISQVFENRSYQARLAQVAELRVSHEPVAAWYLAAWLGDGLRAAGADPIVKLETGAGPASIGLAASEGPLLAVLINGREAEVRIDSIVHRTVFPEATDYFAMREELSVPGRDAVFEKTVASAARLALSSS